MSDRCALRASSRIKANHDKSVQSQMLTPHEYGRAWALELHSQLLDATWKGSQTHLREILSEDSIRSLLTDAAALLSKEPTVIHLAPVNGRAVHVVGDTHGQFHDVMHMLTVTAFAESNDYFVFNGDYVDRGAWGVELVLALVALKLAMPDRVFLMRGNHECNLCTKFYGFQAELKSKFPAGVCNPYTIIKLFLDLFKQLPLATVVNNNTLVVHGGLWRQTPQRSKPARNHSRRPQKRARTAYTDDADYVPDNRGQPVLGTLSDLQRSKKGGADPQGQHLSNLTASDVLWSDPSSEPGLHENESRNVGLIFGPDVTEAFLKANNLKLIVRSHEGPDARAGRDDMQPMDIGYTLDHDTPAGKLVTVFSAPRYPQFQAEDDRTNNKGSVLKLLAPLYVDYEVVTYDAVARPEAPCFYDLDLPGSDTELPETGSDADAGSDASADLTYEQADMATDTAADVSPRLEVRAGDCHDTSTDAVLVPVQEQAAERPASGGVMANSGSKLDVVWQDAEGATGTCGADTANSAPVSTVCGEKPAPVTGPVPKSAGLLTEADEGPANKDASSELEIPVMPNGTSLPADGVLHQQSNGNASVPAGRASPCTAFLQSDSNQMQC